MKIKLRHAFGWLTITCVVLALFRRLIPLAFHEDAVGFWHSFLFPWYADLYLLGSEKCWPFEGELHQYTGLENKCHPFYIMTSLIGVLVWLVIHFAGLVFASALIHDLFFREKLSSGKPDDKPAAGS